MNIALEGNNFKSSFAALYLMKAIDRNSLCQSPFNFLAKLDWIRQLGKETCTRDVLFTGIYRHRSKSPKSIEIQDVSLHPLHISIVIGFTHIQSIFCPRFSPPSIPFNGSGYHNPGQP